MDNRRNPYPLRTNHRSILVSHVACRVGNATAMPMVGIGPLAHRGFILRDTLLIFCDSRSSSQCRLRQRSSISSRRDIPVSYFAGRMDNGKESWQRYTAPRRQSSLHFPPLRSSRLSYLQ